MAVKFKVIEIGQPGVPGGGEKKYYASANVTGELTFAGLTKAIEKISTVSGADIRAVLYAMVDSMVTTPENRQVVRLGKLGSLRVSISSEGKDTPEEVNASAVRNSKMVFSPVKQMLDTLEYQKL